MLRCRPPSRPRTPRNRPVVPSPSSGRRLILHIGLPKSGSSAIQSYLSQNAARLEDRGLRWLPGSRGPNSTELAISFAHRDNAITQAYGIRTEQDRTTLRDRIADRLRTEVDHDLIISSEHLSSMVRAPEEIADLAGFLAGLGRQTLIIGVIRRADHWLPSAYAEAVRSGRAVRLGPTFVDRRAHLLDHQALCARWSAAFGDVRLIPYLETDKEDPAAMPRRFLAACGIPADATADWPQPSRLSRPGLSATGVEVLRQLNPRLELGEWHSGRDRERLADLVAERHPGSGVRLTPAARRALESHGWIQTGIETSPGAYGSGWQEWRDAAPAPVRKPVQPDDAIVEATHQALRRAGFGTRRPITDRARQLLQKIRR